MNLVRLGDLTFAWRTRGGTEANEKSTALKRDEIRLNRHRALALCLSMIFSENRYTLFRIML
jgi:hypothetical protein